ncbi:MAG: CvpA family protein [Pirellulaceae bacterium]
MLTLVLLLIFVSCVAALWFQGLWSNAITLINMLLAMMLAFNYFEPLANMLDGVDRSYTYLWDFLALWGLFALCFGLLRAVTDTLSRKRVAFDFWVETVGRSLLAVWIAWLFIGFICATMHTAPLGPHPLGFQQTPTSGNFLGMAPGRQWLAFLQSRSRGALSRSESDPSKLSPVEEDKNLNVRVFDPESKFILKYYQRRVQFETEPEYRVAR